MSAGGDPTEEVTELLFAWRRGDDDAESALLAKVYDTLHRIATGQLRSERPGHTLQPTALVHEAYLRLIGQRQLDWRDRSHFFGLAAMTMRRILVDHARRRRARKRDLDQAPLAWTIATGPGNEVDLLDLDRALTRFAERFPRAAKVVELRYFAGLELPEVARALEISERTVKRDWQFARAFLRDAMGGSDAVDAETVNLGPAES